MRLGERGSIDLVAADPAVRAAAIFELKSDLTSYEETQRRLDAKIRIAASVIEERLGWRPRHLAAILVLDDTTSDRDRVSVSPLIRAALPAGNVDIWRWLKSPSGDLRGIWFLRDMHPRGTKRTLSSPHRVRRPTSGRPQA